MTFGKEIIIIELIGIIAFAISGAIVAIKKRFDLFGIIVLVVNLTASTGGSFRLLGRPSCAPSNNLQSINGATATAEA